MYYADSNTYLDVQSPRKVSPDYLLIEVMIIQILDYLSIQ